MAWLAAFGLCGVLQAACLVPCAFAAKGALLERVSLPAELSGWTLDKQERIERRFNDQAGRFACQWWYRREPRVCLVSLDYPVPSWHNPTLCYAGNGWQPTARRVLTAGVSDVESDAGEHHGDGAWVELQLSKPTGEQGWLLFGLLDAAGNVLPPSASRWPDVAGELARSPLGSRLLGRGQGSATEAAYQLQAFLSSPGPLSAEEQAEVRRLLWAARAKWLAADSPEAEEAKREP